MPNTVRLHRVLATTPEKLYRAFLEADGGDEAGDAGTNRDGVDRFEAAGHLVPFGDVTGDDLGDGDLRRRRVGRLRGRVRAAGKKEQHREDDEHREGDIRQRIPEAERVVR